jgi:glucose/mannose-6-phosphate isomerase
MLEEDLRKLDASDMLAKIADLPDQLRAGADLAGDAWESLRGIRPALVVIAGMGGSAIGAEILLSYVMDRMAVPALLWRDDRLPGFVDGRSLVVVSSYSGNTPEALACFEGALQSGATVCVVSSDGELLELAGRRSVPHVRLPSGYPPRAAVGYSFSALLTLLDRTGTVESRRDDILECADTLEGLCEMYSSPGTGRNTAMLIAKSLLRRIPIVYCSNRLSAVGLRWKNQFCENSKRLAFAGFLPEMTHNEVMGWEVDHEGLEPGVILLRSSTESPRTDTSFAFIRELVAGGGGFCGEYWGTGPGLLSQIFSLILLGDYASVYLALLRGLDPTPIATIDDLKTRLRGESMEA